MSRPIRGLLFLLAGLLLIVPTAFGQMVSYDDQVNLYHPTATGELGLFNTVAGETLRQGDWSFSIYWNEYDWLAAPALDSMKIPSARSYRDMDLDESRYTVSLGYGLTDRWEIAASLPYVVLDQNAGDLAGFINGYPYQGKFDENGFGKLHIGTKFGLLPLDSTSRLAASLFVDVPVGSSDTGISTSNPDYGIGLHWNKGMFVVGGQYKVVGDRDASDTPYGYDVSLPDEVALNAGLNVPLRFWETTNWINEINAIFYTGGSDLIESPDNPVYLVTGLRHWFGESGWAVNAGFRANVAMMGSDNKSCPYGGLLGLSYAPMHLTPPPPPPAVAPPPPPPAPKPVTPPPPPVTPPHQPVELRTDTIYFEGGSPRVTNIAKAVLDDVALRMKQEPAATALVIGYNEPGEATGPNADVDRRRAEAVRDYLVSRHGIDPSRITVEGHGTEGADQNDNNRRVVVKLIIP